MNRHIYPVFFILSCNQEKSELFKGRIRLEKLFLCDAELAQVLWTLDVSKLEVSD